MNQLSNSEEAPPWLIKAAEAVALFMKMRGIRSFSALAKNIHQNYRTVRKLDRSHPDPTLGFESVAKIFASMFGYINEENGEEISPDNDFESLDKAWAHVTMLYIRP